MFLALHFLQFILIFFFSTAASNPLVLLVGPDGCGKASLVQQACAVTSSALISVDCQTLPAMKKEAALSEIRTVSELYYLLMSVFIIMFINTHRE